MLPNPCPRIDGRRAASLSSASSVMLMLPLPRRFYSNLITKNIAMGGDVEKSANSAFTAGSKRHAATADYEMQDGNSKGKAAVAAAGKSKSNRRDEDDDDDDVGGSAVLGGKSRSSAGPEARARAVVSDEPEGAGPTARMVDPRAVESKSKAEANRREGEAAGGHQGGGGGGGGKVRPREEEGAAGGKTAKRARLGEAGAGEGEVSGDVASSGVGAAGDGGDGGGKREEDNQEEKEMRRTAEGKGAEELDKAQKAAAAKAKKDAAIKAARERFLARKKANA